MEERQFAINWKRRLDYQYRKLDWFSRFVVNILRLGMGIGTYKTGYKEILRELSNPPEKPKE